MSGMRRRILGLSLCGLMPGAMLPGPVPAGEAQPAMGWEEKRLFRPTDGQLDQERRGGVFIYDRLESSTVERAMDEHFERIDNMMFVRVTHPTLKDGGEPVVEDDGCD